MRIEHHGRVAQIDQILLNRLLQVYVIETKKSDCMVSKSPKLENFCAGTTTTRIILVWNRQLRKMNDTLMS